MKPASADKNGEGPQTPRYVVCKACNRLCAVRTGPRVSVCLLSSGCPGSSRPSEPMTAGGIGENLNGSHGSGQAIRTASAQPANPLQYQELYRRECARLGLIAQRRELQNQWLAGLRARIASAKQREVWARRRQCKAEEESALLRKQVMLLRKNLRLEDTVDILRKKVDVAGQREPMHEDQRDGPVVQPPIHER